MNLIFLLVSILFFLYSIRFSYFWWIQSEEYVKLSRKQRNEYRKKLFFMPQLLMFDFYDQNPKVEKWMNRFAGLVFLLLSLIGMFVGLNGPFIQK